MARHGKKSIRVRDQVQTWSASFDSEPGSMLEFNAN